MDTWSFYACRSSRYCRICVATLKKRLLAGFTGVTGFTGSTGDTGFTGFTGFTGATGALSAALDKGHNNENFCMQMHIYFTELGLLPDHS